MMNSDEDATTIFVGNLSESITEELLYELFLQVGPVDNVKIPNDTKGGKCSFGFIRFKHACSSDYAINLLQGTNLCNRTINLQRRNKGGSSNLRHKPPQEQNRYNNHHESNSNRTRPDRHNMRYDSEPRRDLPQPRHIRFDSEPDFDMLLEMGATMFNAPNLPQESRDYRGHNDNPHRSRGSGNRDRGYDNRRYNNNDLSPNDNNDRKQNDRSYGGRKDHHSGGRSHRNDRNHDRRPYDSNNRNRGRY